MGFEIFSNPGQNALILIPGDPVEIRMKNKFYELVNFYFQFICNLNINEKVLIYSRIIFEFPKSS